MISYNIFLKPQDDTIVIGSMGIQKYPGAGCGIPFVGVGLPLSVMNKEIVRFDTRSISGSRHNQQDRWLVDAMGSSHVRQVVRPRSCQVSNAITHNGVAIDTNVMDKAAQAVAFFMGRVGREARLGELIPWRVYCRKAPGSAVLGLGIIEGTSPIRPIEIVSHVLEVGAPEPAIRDRNRVRDFSCVSIAGCVMPAALVIKTIRLPDTGPYIVASGVKCWKVRVDGIIDFPIRVCSNRLVSSTCGVHIGRRVVFRVTQARCEKCRCNSK